MEMLHEDGANKFTLAKKECIPLELKLNVSSKGRLWSHIGTILFEFATEKPQALTSITLTDVQYEFMLMLMGKRSWEDCKGV